MFKAYFGVSYQILVLGCRVYGFRFYVLKTNLSRQSFSQSSDIPKRIFITGPAQSKHTSLGSTPILGVFIHYIYIYYVGVCTLYLHIHR